VIHGYVPIDEPDVGIGTDKGFLVSEFCAWTQGKTGVQMIDW